MAQFGALATPSALAKLSRQGGLDLNHISREEAQDLVNRIAALEDQLNESESNYERLYLEYGKAKAYYRDVEKQIEAAAEAYLAEVEKHKSESKADKATIAELWVLIDEQTMKNVAAETEVETLKRELQKAQDDAADAKQAQQHLPTDHATAVHAHVKTQEALERAEAEVAAARQEAIAAKAAAAQQLALADEKEMLARAAEESAAAAAKALKTKEAAWRKEEAQARKTLEKKEKELQKAAAHLDVRESQVAQKEQVVAAAADAALYEENETQRQPQESKLASNRGRKSASRFQFVKENGRRYRVGDDGSDASEGKQQQQTEENEEEKMPIEADGGDSATAAATEAQNEEGEEEESTSNGGGGGNTRHRGTGVRVARKSVKKIEAEGIEEGEDDGGDDDSILVAAAPLPKGTDVKTTGKRGRPRSAAVATTTATAATTTTATKKQRSLSTKRPVGRPKKISSDATQHPEHGGATATSSENSKDSKDGTSLSGRKRARGGTAAAIATVGVLPPVVEEEEMFYDVEEQPEGGSAGGDEGCVPQQRASKRRHGGSTGAGPSGSRGGGRASTATVKKGLAAVRDRDDDERMQSPPVARRTRSSDIK